MTEASPHSTVTAHDALHRLAPAEGRLTVGLELPLDNDWSPGGESARHVAGRLPGEPDMSQHTQRAVLADQWGIAALWLRDVPLYDPEFGDTGQVFDPFPYLGYLACATSNVVLGTAAVALPLRHPLHVAKMASSIDRLSNGRLLLGVASGDRPIEFPLFNVSHERRAEILRESIDVLKSAWDSGRQHEKNHPRLLPVPTGARIPLVMAGRGGQSLDWLAGNVDGYFTYHRAPEMMKPVVTQWRESVAQWYGDGTFKPLLTTMLVDLCEDPYAKAQPIRFGARLGREALLDYLGGLRVAGVNHVAINLRPSVRPVEEVIEELGRYVVPEFAVSGTEPQSETAAGRTDGVN
ncbi:LLM class oxidoreductase [Salinactinospora qingdaonensis]|uniref:LLM class oxidoreductase n=1 Tax=Salinactinospora qingdaonensis TaxID=702744 RepID=A0ABP7G2Z6_9ACTN